MIPAQFDRLVATLTQTVPRRRALGLGLLGALAPLSAAARPEPAKCLAIGRRCTLAETASQAAGHGKGKGKRKHHRPACSKCCSRFGAAGPDGKARCSCKPEAEPCANAAECCAGQCRNNACTGCPSGTDFCPDGCADLLTDNQHCGACDIACDAGQRCVNGECVCDGTSCPTGCCAGTACKRGTSDQMCGTGGTACQSCAACTTCDGTTCAAQSAICCGAASVCQDGQCVDCASGQRCQDGQCVCDATTCAEGCCAGEACVPTADQDDDACGANGVACVVCAESMTCNAGACVCANDCPTNFVRQADCGCQCPTADGYVLINDACFKQYPSQQACDAAPCPCGGCAPDGICLADHVGACGADGTCPAGAGCVAGSCFFPCRA